MPNPWLFLGIWVAGGALAFAGAMAYAELAALRPARRRRVRLPRCRLRPRRRVSDRVDVVHRRVHRRHRHQRRRRHLLHRSIRARRGQLDAVLRRCRCPYVPLTVSPQTLVAIASIWLLAAVHIRGVGPGRLMRNILAVLKVSALLIFIALGFAFGTGAGANIGREPPDRWRRATGCLRFIPVMFTYSGWNAAAYVAEEIRDPGRNVPKALAIGTVAVIAIYFCLNVLYLYVFSVGELAALKGNVLDVVAERLLGVGGRQHHGRRVDHQPDGEHQRDDLCRPARLLRDGARRRVFPAAAKVHPAYKTPGDRHRRAGRSGRRCWCSPAAPTRSRPIRASRSRCLPASRWRRCSCCGRREPNARAPVQGAGLSGRAGDLRDREFRDSCQRALHRSRQTGDRRHPGRPVSLGLPGDRDGIAAVLVFQEPAHVGAEQ